MHQHQAQRSALETGPTDLLLRRQGEELAGGLLDVEPAGMPSLSGPVSYKGAVPLQRAGHSLCLADWEAHKVALDQSHGLLAWVGHAELTLHPARLKRMT